MLNNIKMKTCLFFISLSVSVVVWGDYTDEQRLRENILKDYNKYVRPVRNENESIQTYVSFIPRHILQLDERTQVLTVEGTLVMEWRDQFLTWKPKDYGSIQVFHLPDHNIWQPDIFLYNSADVGSNVDPRGDTNVLVSYEGLVKWNPPVTFKVYCPTSLRSYPFDKHTCNMKLGSWTLDSKKLNVSSLERVVVKPSEVTSVHWKVEQVSQFWESVVFVPDSYNVVHVSLVIQRVAPLYHLTCVMPAVLSVILTASGFFFDSRHASRYIVGLVNFGIVTFLLLHLSVALPAGSEVPIIVRFCGACNIMAVAFLVVTVIVNSVGRRNGTPPTQLVRLFRGALSKPLCLHVFSRDDFSSERKNYAESSDGTNEIVDDKSQPHLRQDWLLLADGLDRVFFLLFSVVYVIILAATLAA
ncbi:neuronal acetylcholine receptor subunit beta-3-like [Tachypleus tridentatus]|uniref:neuronal acetylcholine receptor subunit beta-3-like n=1 Tax=Tachypleus tridentatus TaxID=6853 RepID=UPI003FCFF526